MPQFPNWKPHVAAVVDATRSRQTQLGELVSQLAARGQEFVGDIRRRVDPIAPATKRDVETQSKLGRSRVSHVLKQFLEEQRRRDVEMLESMRKEMREELEGFAAAIGDELFAADDALATAKPGIASSLDEFDLDDDEFGPDDEIDLVSYEAIIAAEAGDDEDALDHVRYV